MKNFGPVSIIGDEVYNVADDIATMSIPRSTVDESFDYILSELNDVLNGGKLFSQFGANGGFDGTYAGNMTQEKVEAIKSVVLLFRASHIFNGDEYYKNVKNADGTLLFPQSRDNQKWVEARDAAKKIIDSGKWKLVLRDKEGKLVSSVKESVPFKSVYYSSFGSAQNEEAIALRTSSDHDTYPMIPRNSSEADNVIKGAGAYSVPLEFVDLFFTNSGKRIEDEGEYTSESGGKNIKGYFTYDTEDPESADLFQGRLTTYSDQGYDYFKVQTGHQIMKQFLGREARFYQDIIFQNRPLEVPGGQNVATELNFSGNSGPNSTNTHDYPVFGTIARKTMYVGESGWDYTILLRLGEVYLNYAEACAELGQNEEALKYLNMIRARAGVAEYAFAAGKTGERGEECIVINQNDLLKVIYRERLIEMAYENKHYYDVRRWGVANGTWRGADTAPQMTDGWIYPSYHVGGEGGDMTGFNVNENEVNTATDKRFYKRVNTQHRIFTKRMSFLPIPQEEINRNKNSVQNAGWESGEEQ